MSHVIGIDLGGSKVALGLWVRVMRSSLAAASTPRRMPVPRVSSTASPAKLRR